MTIEEAKKAGFRIDAEGWATTWRILKTEKIRRLYSKVRGLDAKDFPTRAKAREALRKRKENEEVNRKSRFIDNFVQPMQEHLSSKSKADAEHVKWLADMQSQTTPITPEQAKMLSRDDVVFMYDIASLGISGIRGDTAINDNSYVTSPLFFTEQAARNRLNEVIAAQAALDKAKQPEAGDKPSPTETVKPTREQQIADGWTDEEIKRAALQPREWTDISQPLAPRNDPVNHPAHYTSSPSGIECIQVTEWMGFLLGNAVKYIWRAGSKGNEKQDLEKAVWYIRRRIEQIEKEEVK